MTRTPVPPRAGPQPARPGAGAVRADHRVVGAILRSPAHRLLSGRVVLLRYRGRRSGCLYTLPVQYAEHDGELIVLAADAAAKQWWRNFRRPAGADVLLRGRWLPVTARVLTGDPELARRYAARFPSAARALRRESAPVFVLISARPSARIRNPDA